MRMRTLHWHESFKKKSTLMWRLDAWVSHHNRLCRMEKRQRRRQQRHSSSEVDRRGDTGRRSSRRDEKGRDGGGDSAAGAGAAAVSATGVVRDGGDLVRRATQGDIGRSGSVHVGDGDSRRGPSDRHRRDSQSKHAMSLDTALAQEGARGRAERIPKQSLVRNDDDDPDLALAKEMQMREVVEAQRREAKRRASQKKSADARTTGGRMPDF